MYKKCTRSYSVRSSGPDIKFPNAIICPNVYVRHPYYCGEKKLWSIKVIDTSYGEEGLDFRKMQQQLGVMECRVRTIGC